MNLPSLETHLLSPCSPDSWYYDIEQPPSLGLTAVKLVGLLKVGSLTSGSIGLLHITQCYFDRSDLVEDLNSDI